MDISEQLLALEWPSEFVVEYESGVRERLLSGEGVLFSPPADDPEGIGFLCADLPQTHPRNQKKGGRVVRFNQLRAIFSLDGCRLWPDAEPSLQRTRCAGR